MKTATIKVDNYIESIYRIEKKEKEIAIETFKEKTGVKVKKSYGQFWINIEDIFTDEPTRQISLCFKPVGYGSVIFLGNINGKTKEQLRYKTTEIQKATEDLVLKLRYTFNEVQEAISEVEKTHGKSIAPVGIIRDRVYYN